MLEWEGQGFFKNTEERRVEFRRAREGEWTQELKPLLKECSFVN